ncbi:MAG: hypothetical protein IIC81_10345, partial [Chloroflexi bacterium]|nr:hypothetical protein [Chloroflexota bacterium]
MLCKDTFSGGAVDSLGGDYTQKFWSQIHRKLQYLHGRFLLFEGSLTTQSDDAINFLFHCPDDHFLDFVEMIFQVDCLWQVGLEEEKLIS